MIYSIQFIRGFVFFFIALSAASRKCGTCGGHCCGVYHRFGKYFFWYSLFTLKYDDTHGRFMSTSLTFLQVHKAQDIGSKRGKISVEDFLYLIRKV